jgi:hypothetical protein
MFEKLPVSLSTLVVVVGIGSTIWGFVNYSNPILNLIGLFTGIPLLLGGVIMKVVELKPVRSLATPSEAVLRARAEQATEIQNQVRSDITKYNYGANAHLENALEFLGLRGLTEAELPQVIGYEEQLREGRYTLLLRFRSPKVPFEQWQESYDRKMSTFFGRDVQVELTQTGPDQVDLALIKVMPSANNS